MIIYRNDINNGHILNPFLSINAAVKVPRGSQPRLFNIKTVHAPLFDKVDDRKFVSYLKAGKFKYFG